MAEKIMIIRHGEKPGAPDALGMTAPIGFLESGESSRYGLTIRGWQRAGALAMCFAPEASASRPAGLATPETIFATGLGPRSESRRMQLTVAPLVQKLGSATSLNTDFLKRQEDQMLDRAFATRGNVLICWWHEAIPAIAARILGDETTAPSHWPESRFDLVWLFDRDGASEPWRFRQVPLRLLAGDLDEPIA